MARGRRVGKEKERARYSSAQWTSPETQCLKTRVNLVYNCYKCGKYTSLSSGTEIPAAIPWVDRCPPTTYPACLLWVLLRLFRGEVHVLLAPECRIFSVGARMGAKPLLKDEGCRSLMFAPLAVFLGCDRLGGSIEPCLLS